MKKFISFILNGIFLIAIIGIAVTVSTLALTKKVNEYKKQNSKGIVATVVKQQIPVLSFSKGIVKKIHVKVGQQVKKGEFLVEIDNPVLRGEVNALKTFSNNVSAQTQAKVAQSELNNLNITSPVNGVVSEILVTEGTPIDQLNKVLTMYDNANIRLLAYLTVTQYQAMQQQAKISVYSERLQQDFFVKPESLSPDEKQTNIDQKKIGLYFVLQNKADAVSFLNNEDVAVRFYKQPENSNKPIDVFINFWNNVLGKEEKGF